jgi:hypothetical protein
MATQSTVPVYGLNATVEHDPAQYPHRYTVTLQSGRMFGVMVGEDNRPWLVREVQGTGGWLERAKIWQSYSGRRPLPGPASLAGKCVAAVRAAFPEVQEPL